MFFVVSSTEPYSVLVGLYWATATSILNTKPNYNRENRPEALQTRREGQIWCPDSSLRPIMSTPPKCSNFRGFGIAMELHELLSRNRILHLGPRQREYE